MGDETTPTKHKRLTEAEWAEARGLYESGRLTKSDLAHRFGISRQAMGEGLNARGAVYGRRSKAIEDATIEGQKNDAQRRAEDIVELKGRQRKMVETIQNLTIKKIAEQVQKDRPIGDARFDIATLQKAMTTIRMGRDELYHLLDLYEDTESDKESEEFILSEYTPEEIDAINRKNAGVDNVPIDDLEVLTETVDDLDLPDLLGEDED